ncbi:hypothetical protein K438DRAFT_1754224 [Mycena galopus ATCC 62051]|nr:hypothetical protein K438DRAFT_1754224 [Mycena galopus ATCC 62051]
MQLPTQWAPIGFQTAQAKEQWTFVALPRFVYAPASADTLLPSRFEAPQRPGVNKIKTNKQLQYTQVRYPYQDTPPLGPNMLYPHDAINTATLPGCSSEGSVEDSDSKISRKQFIGDDRTVMCDLHLGCDTPSLPGLGASATFGDRPPPGITLLKTYPKKGWRPDIANSPSGVVCMLCYAAFVGRDAINTAAAALRKWLLQNFAHSGIEDICTRMREHASQHTMKMKMKMKMEGSERIDLDATSVTGTRHPPVCPTFEGSAQGTVATSPHPRVVHM